MSRFPEKLGLHKATLQQYEHVGENPRLKLRTFIRILQHYFLK